jgi:hypothetical protein
VALRARIRSAWVGGRVLSQWPMQTCNPSVTSWSAYRHIAEDARLQGGGFSCNFSAELAKNSAFPRQLALIQLRVPREWRVPPLGRWVVTAAISAPRFESLNATASSSVPAEFDVPHPEICR